jgi:hypothetical protein
MRKSAWFGIVLSLSACLIAGCGGLSPENKKLAEDIIAKGEELQKATEGPDKLAKAKEFKSLFEKYYALNDPKNKSQKDAFDEVYGKPEKDEKDQKKLKLKAALDAYAAVSSNPTYREGLK